MLDGGDLISDWPYLNALLNTAAMADLVAIQANYSMGEAVHTGVTMIADGSEEADLRLEACMTTDSGIGVVRHAQAGYPARASVPKAKARSPTSGSRCRCGGARRPPSAPKGRKTAEAHKIVNWGARRNTTTERLTHKALCLVGNHPLIGRYADDDLPPRADLILHGQVLTCTG